MNRRKVQVEDGDVEATLFDLLIACQLSAAVSTLYPSP
jgi:hypothetical protein